MDYLKNLKNKILTLDERILLHCPIIETDDCVGGSEEPVDISDDVSAVIDPNVKAHLVSSECLDGTHKLTLDIDLPCKLEESSTPGKYHLTIDKKLPAEDYEKLLEAFVQTGLVDQGIWDLQWKQLGCTLVRLPGVKKVYPDGSVKAKPGTYEVDEENPF